MKIALVHDYLREYGGAERVLEALHEMYPEAPVYVGFFDPVALGPHADRFQGWDIRETWITRLPGYKRWFSPYRIFAPKAFAALDLSEYDVVISSTNAYSAKGIVTRPGAKHICYCHTPSRSLYGYSTMTNWKSNPVYRFFGTLINHYLRIVDFEMAQKVGVFVANSRETQRRISKFYRRDDSVIIFPPVIVPDKAPVEVFREYFLYVGRITASKHVDLAVETCTRLGLPLKVAGTGPSLEVLKSAAGPTVEFLGSVSDAELATLYQGAKALIFPSEDEDFGIVPIEAMGHGTPVVAHRSGGPLETIVEGTTGTFFDDFTVNSLAEALGRVSDLPFDHTEIWKWSQKFGVQEFNKKIHELVKTDSSSMLK